MSIISLKNLFWLLSFGFVAAILVWILAFNIQPRTINKIKLSPFATPLVAANSIQLRLQEELRQSPVWLWGLLPEEEFEVKVLFEFLTRPAGNIPPFDELWLDEELQLKGLVSSVSNGKSAPQVPQVRILHLRDSIQQLAQELAQKLAQKPRRVLIVTATPFAATFLNGSPAWVLAQEKDLNFKSLLLANFPRRRGDEEKIELPCRLPPRDETGTGELGCRIQQKARSLYRHRMTSGDIVGVMDQISSRDFLFLLTKEPPTDGAN
ncbi:MAG: hypothetical protein C5B49_02145 [Bdellovibrio sp.]|nr:MAG: hypothetical protein C5B49_02145 [Bdellovibrio sp.]